MRELGLQRWRYYISECAPSSTRKIREWKLIGSLHVGRCFGRKKLYIKVGLCGCRMDERRCDDETTGFQGGTATVQYATAVNNGVASMSYLKLWRNHEIRG
jgi:hypothetical protein